jgi:hypothetical protein
MVITFLDLYQRFYTKKLDFLLCSNLYHSYSDNYDNLYWVVELSLDSFYFYWYNAGPDENYNLDLVP